MYHYSIIQWLFFFYFYCFAGWCFESAFVSVKSRKLTNRGFMRGPFLPIYGSGAIMMLVVSMPFQDHIFLTYVAGCVGATVLEFVTGVAMEALFQVRYWDYSNQKFNFMGHVCLGSSLVWGVFTILMTEVIQVQVEKVVMLIPGQVLTAVTLILTAGIFADFALSFKAAIDLRNLLVKMEHAREELVHIQKRLSDIVSTAGTGIGNKKDAIVESVGMAKDGVADSVSDLKNAIESKLEWIKNAIQTKPAGYLESVREELFELRVKYTRNVKDRDDLGREKDFFRNHMIRSNPGMTSRKYSEYLEELKNQIRRNGR
ncbi:MAG: putative ABC transporter permease [bacterium]|nr:putative ABC transporter permease [bacterium]